MLTHRGFWFLLVTLALLAAGVWGHAAVLCLVCLTLLLWFFAAWLTFAVQVRLLSGKLHLERMLSDERGPVSGLWAGSSYRVRMRLESERAIGSPYLRVRDRVPYGAQLISGDDHAEGSVSAGRPLAIEYQVTCTAPGPLRFEGLSVEAADPQGFFYHHAFLRDVVQYRVLPPLADAGGHIPSVKRHNVIPLLGSHRLLRPGTGSELLDLRDYLPGDPPRTIAWKVSARRDRLITKEFESEVPVRCTLFVDISESVRVGNPAEWALTRLIEIAAAVVQAAAAARDLTGLCLVGEQVTDYVRPARGSRQLLKLLGLLADAAGGPPGADASRLAGVPVESLLALAYSFARETYPELLHEDINSFPAWLPWLFPQPAYTLHRPPLRARSLLHRPWVWLRLLLRRMRLRLRQAVLARLSRRQRLRYRWRKQLAALLAVLYHLEPGGLSLLLEDDESCVRYLQRFLAEHRVPYLLPLYDAEGRYLFAAPGKVPVLARALLHAVARGRDNELYVLLVDLLEIEEHLAPLLRAVKVALARHHQVMVVCPWPDAVSLPSGGCQPPARGTQGADAPRSGGASLLDRIITSRFHRAYQRLRRTFGRLGVPVLCARQEDAVPLVLERIERLRSQRRGVR
jgi:uncharacterized protein (DUF58 family)